MPPEDRGSIDCDLAPRSRRNVQEELKIELGVREPSERDKPLPSSQKMG
jgi:hypothetical protein